MRLIDADALLSKYISGNILTAQTDYAQGARDIIEDILDAPTIEPEQKKGKWIGKPIAGYATVRCSVCKDVFRENTGRWNFCPNCGAEMGENNETT